MSTLVLVLCGLAVGFLVNGMRRSARIVRHPNQSRRNLPYLFAVFALLLAIAAILLPSLAWFSIAPQSDLKSFTGSLVEAPSWGTRSIINLRLQTNDGVQDVVVEDLSHSEQILALKAGDNVSALVYPFLGQDDLWELKHEQMIIESCQDTYVYRTQQLEQGTTAALWMGLAASILFVTAVALRMHFGVWREPRASIMDIATPTGAKATPPETGLDTSHYSTPSVPAIGARGDVDTWHYSTLGEPAASTISAEAGEERSWQARTKKKCPKCKSSCYVFDRQCHRCSAKLPSGPFVYWLLAEALLLSVIVFAFMNAGVWGAAAVLALGFVVERVVKSFARQNTTAAGAGASAGPRSPSYYS